MTVSVFVRPDCKMGALVQGVWAEPGFSGWVSALCPEALSSAPSSVWPCWVGAGTTSVIDPRAS